MREEKMARAARELASLIEGDAGQTFYYVECAEGGRVNIERMQVLIRHMARIAAQEGQDG